MSDVPSGAFALFEGTRFPWTLPSAISVNNRLIIFAVFYPVLNVGPEEDLDEGVQGGIIFELDKH